MRGRCRGSLLVAFGRRIRAGRAGSILQLALFFGFLLLPLLQFFAAFFAGVIRFGQSLFPRLLGRLRGRGVGILLLRSDCRLALLLRFLLLVRLRRFIAHDAPTSVAQSRCQRPLAGWLEMRPRRQRVAAQIALAWLLAQKPSIVPIPGTTKLHRLEENLGAVNVELPPEDLHEIDEAASEIDVQEARYPEKLEAMTGR